jgi:1-acyl-sn-glycerol-3-phosphate acyltransferase
VNAPSDFPRAPYVDRPLGRGLHVRFAGWMLHALGWRVVLAQPVPLRCVVVIYPHTSNWDFPIGLMAKWVTGVHFRFVGKDTLFAGPFGRLFTRWGGIPVNRREHTGVIAQLAQRFATEDDFRLVFAPEGTRSRTEHWKSGFYHLARAAGVPVALAFIDYARREVGVGAHLDLTGDVDADLARIASFYAGKVGKRPEHAGPIRLPAQAGDTQD